MPSKASKTSTSDPSHVYSVGDVVLAKMKGFPAWPGHIVDEDKAPAAVRKEKPKGKSNLVQFFPAGDHAWTPSRDLSLLTPKEIDAYVNSGGRKKGDLLEGYKIARNPREWAQEKADQQAEYDELMAQQMADGGEEDQLASEDEGKSKKRKRASEGKKDAGKGKKAAAGKKAGKSDDAPASKKAKTSGSSDPDGEKVKTWRHKLQKVFLGKNEIAADEMSKCAEYFDDMESFEMKTQWLQESKLGKVLKRIALMKDDQIPHEEKYSFRERSSALAKKWATLTGGADAESSPKPADAVDETPAPVENGAAPAAEEDKKDDAAEDKKDEPAAEEDKADETPAAEEAKMDVDAQPAANGDAKEEPAAEEKKEDAAAPTESS